MIGNQNPFDPTETFRAWIQKSGAAQTEFMRNFASMMGGQTRESFDPLRTLTDMSGRMAAAQSEIIQNAGRMQSQGIDKMMALYQMLPSFAGWGAYKTSVGSNGRISIPEAEREALGLSEGDLVQVIVLPLGKKSKDREVIE
ncbi:transcriptional regulator [Cenarchaeum symbiosum A]|uniref:Transcriptional regulator n=1 Tax=Cenarchaeum symbiosum (strain A) TaxID=414004 RepID=A0RX83_CENSY|nr:transcriptional regulator [Cenarchaeum symbiosum A]